MSTRLLSISTEILTQLSTEGNAVDSAILHALVNARIAPRAEDNEFEAALRFCKANGWVVSVGNALRGVRYQITDNGEGALLK